MKSVEERFIEKVDKNAPNGCWEWTASCRGDYGCFRFESKNISAHRFSYELFKGPIPKGKLVCHSCDNPRCVNPDHLWLGTAKENMEDAVLKGRVDYGKIPRPRGNSHYLKKNPLKILFGDDHGQSKLTSEKVINAREEYRRGIKLKKLSEKYGVSKTTMYDALSGVTWKSVDAECPPISFPLYGRSSSIPPARIHERYNFNFHTGKCTCGHTNPYIGSHCCEKCGTEAEVDREPEKKPQGRQMFDPGGPLIPPPRALLPKREPESEDPTLEVLEVGPDFEENRTTIKRPTFEEVYMMLATIIARRSTCVRRRVGCVITSSDYRRVLSVGYNGNAAGLPNSCDDPNASGSCGCLHAEENAALSCFESASTPKIVFTTVFPCKMCAKRLIQLGGVEKVCYLEDYRNTDAAKIFEAVGIQTERIVSRPK